jgi:hypothetical protein
LDDFTWETRSGGAGGGQLSGGTGGTGVACSRKLSKTRPKRFGGRGCCYPGKQDLAGFWSISDFEFSQKINAQNA